MSEGFAPNYQSVTFQYDNDLSPTCAIKETLKDLIIQYYDLTFLTAEPICGVRITDDTTTTVTRKPKYIILVVREDSVAEQQAPQALGPRQQQSSSRHISRNLITVQLCFRHTPPLLGCGWLYKLFSFNVNKNRYNKTLRSCTKIFVNQWNRIIWSNQEHKTQCYTIVFFFFSFKIHIYLHYWALTIKIIQEKQLGNY